jgi:hypothetical protein
MPIEQRIEEIWPEVELTRLADVERDTRLPDEYEEEPAQESQHDEAQGARSARKRSRRTTGGRTRRRSSR